MILITPDLLKEYLHQAFWFIFWIMLWGSAFGVMGRNVVIKQIPGPPGPTGPAGINGKDCQCGPNE